MSWRNLIRQRLRTTLTVIGVAIGVSAVVAFGALAEGVWASTDAAITTSGGDVVVFQAGVSADLLSKLDEIPTREALLADPEVEAAYGALTHLLPVGGQPFTIVLGLEPAQLQADGDRITMGRPARAPGEVQMGSIAARFMEKTVGDSIDVGGQAFEIVGVFQSGVVFFDGAVVLTLPALQTLINQPGQVTNFQLRLRSQADADGLVERLEAKHPQLVAITGAGDYHKVDQGLVIMEGVSWAITFMALLIGSVIVTNTMWLTVHERTREIGVLRALGWSQRTIVGLIVAEACGVGCIAFVVGAPAGAGLAHLATAFKEVAGFVDPIINTPGLLRAGGMAVVLSVVGALLPAWRAARISPVEALRYE